MIRANAEAEIEPASEPPSAQKLSASAASILHAPTSSPPACQLDAICGGEPLVMGFEQGCACRDKLRLIDALLPQLEAFRLARPRWLPYRLFCRLAESRARRMVRRPLLRDDAELHARLEGISLGSGTRLPLLYLVNALECLMASPRRCTVMPPLGACSAVAVRGSRSATGGPMIARNFDYLPLVQPLYTLRESRPTGQFRSLDFTLAPMAGAVDGINERGLAITYDYGFTIDDVRAAGPPISASISAALARNGDGERSGEAHHVAASMGWRAVDAGRCRGRHCLAGTLDDAGRAAPPCAGRGRALPHQLVLHRVNASGADFAGRDVHLSRPAALRNKRPLDSSRHRDARFVELLARHERLGWDELTAIMSDHGPSEVEGQSLQPTANGHGLCVHSDYWYTTAALQFDPRERTMRTSPILRLARRPSARFRI